MLWFSCHSWYSLMTMMDVFQRNLRLYDTPDSWMTDKSLYDSSKFLSTSFIGKDTIPANSKCQNFSRSHVASLVLMATYDTG